MDLILLQDVDNLGVKFDQVKVKAGYGRNFLIPKGLAKVATPSNVKHLTEIKKQQSAKIAKQMDEMKVIAAKLASEKLTIGAKAGSTGKLFGSVTTVQIAEELLKQFGIKVDRKRVHIQGDIKELGTYTATVDLFKDVTADVTLDVIEE